MKRFPAFLILISSCLHVLPQQGSIINIPDIPGYKTMVCDFHMHTVFSDGSVWPTVRVDEAIDEGLDAIAVTDHLEYRPHADDLDADRNRSWQIAKEYAKDKGLIVIPGAEITKGMPPGHFNALFIKDAEAIYHKDYNVSLEAAADQGAFIMWNHPGWKAQQPDTTLWWDEHTFIYEHGWMHGIEVINGPAVTPEAIDWAIDKGLAVIGSSDQHGPFKSEGFDPDGHRTTTLAFVAERSEGGIREALFNGRTVSWYNQGIIGKESICKALFLASVEMTPPVTGNRQYAIYNPTHLDFSISLTNKVYNDWTKNIHLAPGSKTTFKVQADATEDQIEIRVNNMLVGTDTPLLLPLSMIHSVHQ